MAFVLATGLLFSAPERSAAQVQFPLTGDLATDLKNLERRFSTAVVFGDVKTLNEILDDNFIDTDEQGRQTLKKEYIAGIKAGDRKILSLSLNNLRIHGFVYGAVITGRAMQKGTLKGEEIPDVASFTDTFAMVGGTWKFIASHRSAPTPKPGEAAKPPAPSPSAAKAPAPAPAPTKTPSSPAK
jgi:hypothetical protein